MRWARFESMQNVRMLPMETAMIRKVSSLTRERNELDRRISNIIQSCPDVNSLAVWIAQEIFNIVSLSTTANEQAIHLLPESAWCAGFPRPVRIVWVPLKDRSLADQRLVPKESVLLLTGGTSHDATGRCEWARSLYIEQVELLTVSVEERSVRQIRLFGVDESGSPLSSDQGSALLMFSERSTPALTRYN